jgi:hypothetical protein
LKDGNPCEILGELLNLSKRTRMRGGVRLASTCGQLPAVKFELAFLMGIIRNLHRGFRARD